MPGIAVHPSTSYVPTTTNGWVLLVAWFLVISVAVIAGVIIALAWTGKNDEEPDDPSDWEIWFGVPDPDGGESLPEPEEPAKEKDLVGNVRVSV